MKKKFTTNFNLLPYCLFFLCLFGFTHSASAQIRLDTATLAIKRTVSCGGSQTFTDDDSGNGLYFDEKSRRDTIVLCPNRTGRQVRVSFTSFDVASGDVLTFFDGDVTKNPSAPSQTASGTGSSRAFGGWVQANCDPAINSTGCVSFEFFTNGDNGKGNGWQASITCESSSTTVQCPNNVTDSDDCNNLDGMITVTIPKPTFSTCGGTGNAMVNITSSCNLITGGTMVADGGTLGTFTLPLGTHSITATSVTDESQRCTYFVILDQPNMTCNDNVTSTIGLGCKGSVTVDDVLESPCVGNAISYRLSVDLGGKAGKKTKTVSGASFGTLNSDPLEVFSEDFICGREYAVEITRIVSVTSCGGPSTVEKSCTGRVRFVDNTAPVISFNAPTLTTCGNLTGDEVKRKLTISVTDNCSVKDTIVSVGTFPTNFCTNNLSVPVTVTAVDFCGNSKTETFNVGIIRPTKFFRPRDTVLDCGSGFGPEIAGYPVLDTDGDDVGDLPIRDNTCNFIATFSDQEVTATNSKTKKIFRTWQITDWCKQNGPVTLDQQLIEIKDTGKPAINCPSGGQQGTENNPYIATAGSDCTGSVFIPSPTTSDACGGNVTIVFEKAVDTHSKKEFTSLNNLPVGQYFANYYGRDETGNNSDTCQIFFTVQDSRAPQALCVNSLNVSLTGGVARLRVQDIDAGSQDNCTAILSKEIRKQGGEWGQTVTMTCAEIEADNRVFLRVTDQNGVTNTCHTFIIGKDNSVPNCGDLQDRTVKCEDFQVSNFGSSTDANDNKIFDDSEWEALTGNLETTYNQAFGNPNCGGSNCGSVATIEQQYQLIAANCGETKIRRRYRAVSVDNSASDWKMQNVTLTISQEFSVTFPADWSGNCGDNFPEATLDLNTSGCSILAWSHQDKRFEGNSDACYYIERTYSVTNWCLHEAGQTGTNITRIEDIRGNSEGQTVTHQTLANVGRFQYIQVLRVNDVTKPTVTVNAVDDCITGTECNATKTFSISASDCLGEEGLTYSYELVEDGNIVQSGETASFSATVANKSYQVNWKVSDNCGNVTAESVNYTFKDCVRPAPFCLDGVATTLDDEGKAEVWAIDLNQKSADNCSAEDKLEFRIYHPVLAETVTRPQSGDATSVVLALPKNLTLTCDQLGTQAVELYVVDEAGNWDFCTGSIFVQDGNGACGTDSFDPNVVAMVAGGILTTNNIPLQGVTLTAKGTALYEQQFTTDDSGIFEMNLPQGIGYVISFDREDRADNGVTVFDLIMISKHILGITPFTEPYQMMAADVNNSNSVTSFDLVLLRKIILGIDTEFTDNTPWRFMPANNRNSGNDAQSPTLSETITIPILTKNLTSLDYLAIKVGDLNGSAKVDGFTQSEDRNNGNPILLDIENQFIKKGEVVEVPVTVADLADLDGLQYTLSFEGMELAEVQSGLAAEQHFSVKDNQELSVVWDAFSAEEAAVNNLLFTAQFVATTDSQLKDLLTIRSTSKTEAVTTDNEVQPIALNFIEKATTPEVKLYQNTPNPFSENTTVRFDLGTASPVQLDIFNLQGALLQRIEGDFTKGTHEVQIEQSALGSSGVLIYQLTTASAVLSKKMIVL
ncbi:MAG: T9SS type A sorting domain-containing protein [Bacteroidota bacterium]